eukprot:7869473-Alexandrium_andersonii.AAC.1
MTHPPVLCNARLDYPARSYCVRSSLCVERPPRTTEGWKKERIASWTKQDNKQARWMKGQGKDT